MTWEFRPHPLLRFLSQLTIVVMIRWLWWIFHMDFSEMNYQAHLVFDSATLLISIVPVGLIYWNLRCMTRIFRVSERRIEVTHCFSSFVIQRSEIAGCVSGPFLPPTLLNSKSQLLLVLPIEWNSAKTNSFWSWAKTNLPYVYWEDRRRNIDVDIKNVPRGVLFFCMLPLPALIIAGLIKSKAHLGGSDGALAWIWSLIH